MNCIEKSKVDDCMRYFSVFTIPLLFGVAPLFSDEFS